MKKIYLIVINYQNKNYVLANYFTEDEGKVIRPVAYERIEDFIKELGPLELPKHEADKELTDLEMLTLPSFFKKLNFRILSIKELRFHSIELEYVEGEDTSWTLGNEILEGPAGEIQLGAYKFLGINAKDDLSKFKPELLTDSIVPSDIYDKMNNFIKDVFKLSNEQFEELTKKVEKSQISSPLPIDPISGTSLN